MQILFQELKKNFEGKIIINSHDVSKKVLNLRKKLNLSYIPENRLGVGLAPGVSVLDNSIVREYFQCKTMVLIYQKIKC